MDLLIEGNFDRNSKGFEVIDPILNDGIKALDEAAKSKKERNRAEGESLIVIVRIEAIVRPRATPLYPKKRPYHELLNHLGLTQPAAPAAGAAGTSDWPPQRLGCQGGAWQPSRGRMGLGFGLGLGRRTPSRIPSQVTGNICNSDPCYIVRYMAQYRTIPSNM